MRNRKCIRVFEYQKLHYGRTYNDVVFSKKHFDALVKLNDFHDNKYFTVINEGIKFRQYVGILQIDGLSIEILPKIDASTNNKKDWQQALIDMLKATKRLKVNNVGNANVNEQSIHLLDIYFEWYLNELQTLIHQGLSRQYYKRQNNLKSLKGKLIFSKQITKNLIHKERFFSDHQVYDHDHLIHQILAEALEIVERFSKGGYLYSHCKTISIDFPETTETTIDKTTFNQLRLNRKTQSYKTALEIARLIILNFAPNVTNGKENMLALLFDMNTLWEEYILIRLRQAANNSDLTVLGQKSRVFWNGIKIRPDIIIKRGEEVICIIDTKWKQISNKRPSMDDLRQMYVYNDYWQSPKSFLLYPSNHQPEKFLRHFQAPGIHSCGLAWTNVLNKHARLDKEIGHKILENLNLLENANP